MTKPIIIGIRQRKNQPPAKIKMIEEAVAMIGAYLLLLMISIVFFYLTRGAITNAMARFVISGAIFIVLSITITVVISRGHAPPPGSKKIDMEEMKKIRRELNMETHGPQPGSSFDAGHGQRGD